MFLELIFHVLIELVLFRVGRLVIIIATFGKVRPVTLKEIWACRAQKDRAMEIYYQSTAVTIVGTIALGAVLALTIAVSR